MSKEDEKKGWSLDIQSHVIKSDGNNICVHRKKFKDGVEVGLHSPKHPVPTILGCLKYAMLDRKAMGYDMDSGDQSRFTTEKELKDLIERNMEWHKKEVEKYKHMTIEDGKDMAN